MKVVTVYNKPGCHLCTEVEQVLSQVARRRRFKVIRKNILEDAADQERYHAAIPVILVDGEEIARYRLTAFDLEAALAR